MTHDIALFPPESDLEDFGWRLSIAELVQDGPFSHFDGVDRYLAVLEGCLLIETGDGSVQRLAAGSAPIRFAGELPVHGRVIEGPVRDCNLMVRRSAFRGRLTRLEGVDQVTASATTIVVALAEAIIHIDDVTRRFDRVDAVLIRGHSRVRSDGPIIIAEIHVDGPAS